MVKYKVVANKNCHLSLLITYPVKSLQTAEKSKKLFKKVRGLDFEQMDFSVIQCDFFEVIHLIRWVMIFFRYNFVFYHFLI